MTRTVARLTLVAMLVGLAIACAKKTPKEKLADAFEALQKNDPLGAIVQANDVLREVSSGTVAIQARALLFNCYFRNRHFKECHRVLGEILDETGLDNADGTWAARMKLRTYEEARLTTDALTQARSFLEAATTGTPFWAELKMREGGYLLAMDRLTTAQQVFADVLTNPEVPEEAHFAALDRLTVCYRTTDTARAGIEFFQQYLDDEPSTNLVPNAYMLIGYLASLVDEDQLSSTSYQRGFEAFDALYDQVSGAEKKSEVLMRYALARNYKGDVDKAIELIRKGLKEFPINQKRLDLYYQLVEIYASNERYDEAIEVCRQIPSEFPNNPERIRSYFLIAQIHREQKKYKEAIEDYQEIMALFPQTRLAQQASYAIRYTEFIARKEAETSATLALESGATTGTETLTTGTLPTTAPAAIAPPPLPPDTAPTTPPIAPPPR
jgi:tetratricopeptide (TPR) repeat protein